MNAKIATVVTAGLDNGSRTLRKKVKPAGAVDHGGVLEFAGDGAQERSQYENGYR